MILITVLGHRLQTDTPIELPVDGGKFKFHPVTCASMHRKRLKTLFEHFDEVCIIDKSPFISWRGVFEDLFLTSICIKPGFFNLLDYGSADPILPISRI